MSLPYGVCCICGQTIAPDDADRICWECDSEEETDDEESK